MIYRHDTTHANLRVIGRWLADSPPVLNRSRPIEKTMCLVVSALCSVLCCLCVLCMRVVCWHMHHYIRNDVRIVCMYVCLGMYVCMCVHIDMLYTALHTYTPTHTHKQHTQNTIIATIHLHPPPFSVGGSVAGLPGRNDCAG